ncbi:MAG: hypothetical protein OCD03_10600 [Hyphomicrobiales bacterium]
MQKTIDYFTLDGFGGFLVFLIGIIFTIVLIVTIYWWASKSRLILKAISAIRTASGKTENEKRAAFVDKYLEIDHQLREIKSIGECWREFRETIELPDINSPDDASQYIRNENRPQTYFKLTNGSMHAPILRNWPNILVGLGLVLTFAGLIAALSVAGQDLDTVSDQDGMKRVLGTLLDTAGAKFYASASALGASIILGLIQKMCFVSLQKKMGRLNGLLEERMEFDAQASISRKQLHVLRLQHHQLQSFNQDFALKVGEAVRDAFSSSNTEVVDSLKEVANKLEAMADKTSEGVSKSVGDKLDSALSGTLEKMNNTLKDVQLSLGGLPEQMNDAVSALSQSTADHMNDGAKSVANNLTGIVQPLQRAVDTMSDGSEKFVSNMAGFQGALQEGLIAQTELADNLKEAGQLAREAVAENTNIVSQNAKAAEKVGLATEAIVKSSTMLQDAIEIIQTTNERANIELADGRDRIKDLITQSQADMERHVVRYDSLDEKFSKVFSGFNNSMVSQQQQLAEHVNKIDTNFGNAIDSLTGLVEDLSDTIEANHKANR